MLEQALSKAEAQTEDMRAQLLKAQSKEVENAGLTATCQHLERAKQQAELQLLQGKASMDLELAQLRAQLDAEKSNLRSQSQEALQELKAQLGERDRSLEEKTEQLKETAKSLFTVSANLGYNAPVVYRVGCNPRVSRALVVVAITPTRDRPGYWLGYPGADAAGADGGAGPDAIAGGPRPRGEGAHGEGV
eukprot:156758-Pyramimonas_sp.AAC.1